MIALLYFIFFFFIYFPISFWIIRKIYFFAKQKYQRGRVGGFIAAFIMYNLVFWDWIPVILIHKHLCETESGFWIYKTPEQWVKEHPEVIGQNWGSNYKTENVRMDFGNTVQRYLYNHSVYKEISQHSKIDFTKTIYRREVKVVDSETGDILFRSVDFSPIAQYKYWLAESIKGERYSCSKSAENDVLYEFGKIKDLVKGDKK